MNGISHKWQFNLKMPEIYILANPGPQISVPPHTYYICYINGWKQFDCMKLFPEHSRREFSQTAWGRPAKLDF